MDRPKIGVAAFLQHPQNPSSILMGTRLSSHGAGTLQCPGGHLEHGESFAQTAIREVKEETGLDVGRVRFVTDEEGKGGKSKHYVTIFVVCEIIGEEVVARTMEPTKCSGWEWIPWTSMWEWAGAQAAAEDAGEPVDKKLFLPLVNLWRERKELASGLAEL
ncbi:NUDIX domain [Pyrenophora seminiperda CCB06]|uniref:NUDIX domain n=1 Tax=Pyrenophora seminiperda CCB06 TaxID=1302712 RepID=A0A3M7MG25_9PLEO|nr:NUDIX domain [Pyrenophora seminiperda CCB06]